MSRKTLSLPLALVLLLSACGGAPTTEVTPTPEPTPEVVVTPAPTPEPTPDPRPINPLTGLPMDHGDPNDRPIAIMLNNLKQALPQLGVSQADIIYEVLAEGGITRMLGVYQSVEGVGSIGSVRSSRPYYLELALGLDAIYLHAGGSPDAYAKIKSWNVTALNCVNGPYEGSLFWRDQWRRKNLGYEHSVITSGEVITERFPTYSFRQTHEDGYVYDMTFAEDGTPAGESAQTVTVPFSYYKTGVFDYDAASGRYLVSEYGEPHIDGNNDTQVSVTNLIVIQTRCAAIPGDDYGRITVDLSSGGEGWFACGGKYIPITWEKDAPDGQLRYYTADGSPLTLGAGNSYVCIVPTGSGVTFS